MSPDCKHYQECGAEAVCWTCRCCEEHCPCDMEADDDVSEDEQAEADAYFSTGVGDESK